MSVGDQILSLNGHSLEFSSYTDAADLIRRASRPFFLELVKNTRMYNRFQSKIKRLKKQVVEDKQKTDSAQVSGVGSALCFSLVWLHLCAPVRS